MPRIPSGGRDLEQEKADKMFDSVKKIYERSGANIGPRQPMSEDMKRRVGAEVDKLEKKPRSDVKESKAVSADSLELHDKKTGKWSPIRGSSLGGSSGAGTSVNPIEIMPGAELDPKAMIGRAKKERMELEGMKRGGKVKSASVRADGIAQRGKTRGMMK